MAKPQAAVAVKEPALPAHLQGRTTSRGNESVNVEDIIIPRLEIVQALSPCKKKSDPTYIPDADDGMLYNNVTRELYGDEVHVLPIYFRKEYLVWVDRTKSDGQGFRGSFPTAEAAQHKIEELGEDDLQIIDTAQQFCVLLHKDGRAEDIVISMARSKMKVSRRWNSLIRGQAEGLDRWAKVYKITTVEEKGKKGTYYNYNVAIERYNTKEEDALALSKYKQIASGRVKADVSGDIDTSTHDFDL